MAAPNLRVVRRPKNGVRRALTAASQLLDDPAAAFKSSVVNTGRGDWQDQAWDMLDIVGELRYYVSWRANSCSRVRLIASELDPDSGMPTGECDNARVVEIVKAIAGGPLGQGQLLKRGVECLTVPGELWIAIVITELGERWLVLTRDEIKRKGQVVEIALPEGGVHELDPGVDTMFRVWNPRPRKAHEADSPVRSTMDSLKEIVRTTKTISNASKSRLIGNGVVFVPQEMSLPSSSSPGAMGDIDMELTGSPAVKQLQELLFQVAQTAYDDEDSMAALIPMFAAVPGEQVKNVSHLKFDNSVTDIAIKTRNDAIARLAMGLDVSPERLLGLGSNSNHWSAWQIGDEDVRLHIIPPVETICSALTDQVLVRMLELEGLDPTGYVVWHDSSMLTADPDLTDEATNAFDRGAITGAAYREFLGLGDTGYDLTTLEGWQEWAQDRVSVDPTLLNSLLPLLDTLDGVVEISSPPPPPVAEQPPAIEQNPQQEPQTADNPPAPAGQTASAQSAVVEIMVTRALELAGKRRRTRADYERLRDVPMHETHRFMQSADRESVPDLIRGWDSALEEDVLERLGINTDALRSVVRNRVLAELTRPVVDV